MIILEIFFLGWLPLRKNTAAADGGTVILALEPPVEEEAPPAEEIPPVEEVPEEPFNWTIVIVVAAVVVMAAVGVQRRRTDAKAHTGHRNRNACGVDRKRGKLKVQFSFPFFVRQIPSFAMRT